MSRLSDHLSRTYGAGSSATVAAMVTGNTVYKDANGQVRVAGTGIIIAGYGAEIIDDSLQTYKYQPKHGIRSAQPINAATPA